MPSVCLKNVSDCVESLSVPNIVSFWELFRCDPRSSSTVEDDSLTSYGHWIYQQTVIKAGKIWFPFQSPLVSWACQNFICFTVQINHHGDIYLLVEYLQLLFSFLFLTRVTEVLESIPVGMNPGLVTSNTLKLHGACLLLSVPGFEFLRVLAHDCCFQVLDSCKCHSSILLCL